MRAKGARTLLTHAAAGQRMSRVETTAVDGDERGSSRGGDRSRSVQWADIFKHNWQRTKCKECQRASICKHNR